MNIKLPFVIASLGLALSSGCNDVVDNLDDESKDQISEDFSSLFNDFNDDEAATVSTTVALEAEYIETEEASFVKGSARLAGVVGVSEMTPKILAKMAGINKSSSYSQLLAKAASSITASNIKVYWMDGKGNKNAVVEADLNIEIYHPVSGDPQFIISGVKDGLNYVIEIEVLDENNNPKKLTNIAYVPKGETKSAKIAVSPTTTVVTEVVVQKIKTSYFKTGGESLSQNYIEDLNDTLTTVIKEVISESADNPDFEITKFTQAMDSKEALDNLVAKIVTNDDISEQVAVVEKAAVTKSLEFEETVDSDEGRKIMGDIFTQLLNEQDGGGAPQYLIHFFGDQYAAGTLKTVNDVMDAIYAGIEFNDDESGFSSAGALTAFTDELDEIFSTIDSIAQLEAKTTLTIEEKAELKTLRVIMSDIPDVVLATFPISKKDDWLLLDGSTDISVPQSITLTIFVVEKYLKDLVSFEKDDDGDVKEVKGYDFDPLELMELYGWDEENIDEKYQGISIEYFAIHPNTVWDGTDEINVLNAQACYEQIGDFEVSKIELTYPNITGTTSVVELSVIDYASLEVNNDDQSAGSDNENASPAVDDELAQNSDDHDTEKCLGLDPWYEAEKIKDKYKAEDVQGDYVDWNGVWSELKTNNKVVTDFGSGSYSVKISYTKEGSSDSVTETFEKRVIRGMNNLQPVLTSPKAEPKSPDNGATQAQWDSFNVAQSEFSLSAFPVKNEIVISWNEPDYSQLPEGVIPVYQLDIGHEVCGQTGESDESNEMIMLESETSAEGEASAGNDSMTTSAKAQNETDVKYDVQENDDSNEYPSCHWNHVYATWEKDIRIYGNRFVVPVSLEEQELTESPYRVNVSVSFVDEKTGEYLGRGGDSNAPFRIGDEIDLTGTFQLTGKVTNVPVTDASLYKVALLEESCSQSEQTSEETKQPVSVDKTKSSSEAMEQNSTESEDDFESQDNQKVWVCSTKTLSISDIDENGNYTLEPHFSDIMKRPNNAWVDVRVFLDSDDNDQLDSDNSGNSEQMFWANTQVNFNVNNGLLYVNSMNCSDQPSDDSQDNNCDYTNDLILPDSENPVKGPDFDLSQQTNHSEENCEGESCQPVCEDESCEMASDYPKDCIQDCGTDTETFTNTEAEGCEYQSCEPDSGEALSDGGANCEGDCETVAMGCEPECATDTNTDTSVCDSQTQCDESEMVNEAQCDEQADCPPSTDTMTCEDDQNCEMQS